MVRASILIQGAACAIAKVCLRAYLAASATGRSKSTPGGEPVTMIDANWARLKFSGQTLSPMLAVNDQAAVDPVAYQRNAIACINETSVDKRVRGVFRLAQ